MSGDFAPPGEVVRAREGEARKRAARMAKEAREGQQLSRWPGRAMAVELEGRRSGLGRRLERGRWFGASKDDDGDSGCCVIL